mmetsp:Transcript_13765/g.38968  ORF Transcript_13765/g.38968 Transcript_13765/m.38968 type:complete len:282 (-) Transcript_13765:196-1041(-)
MWARCELRGLLFLALCSVAAGVSLGGQRFNKIYVPHISECAFCKQCVGDVPRRLLPEYSPDVIFSPRLAKALFGVMDDQEQGEDAEELAAPINRTDSSSGSHSNHHVRQPGADRASDDGLSRTKHLYMDEVDVRSSLSRCETCRGCKSQLELWVDAGTKEGMKFSEKEFVPVVGRSSTWLFRAPSEKALHGSGVAKVWCIPFKKREGIKVDKCEPRSYERIMTKILAYNKLARDCGMADLVPESWVEHIRTTMPETGSCHSSCSSPWPAGFPGAIAHVPPH